MQIWVDADACPNVIKEILFRAAERQKIEVILVANQALRVPRSPFIKTKQVGTGFDVADNYIAQNVQINDLVITADIPLAAQVIERQAQALNPRGEFYTLENIQQRLSMRNFMEELRSSGAITGGPAALNQQDRQAFANQLDRFLARYAKTKLNQAN
ncbi:MAG: YaiI/YqxD family protein [Thiothrix sp.]|nr:MAG: YaiI/YqxD family protein [Thiothrix sp.]